MTSNEIAKTNSPTALAKAGATWAQIAAALDALEVPAAPRKTPLPSQVKVTFGQQDALRFIAEDAGDLAFPETHRQFSPEEKYRFNEAFATWQQAKKAIENLETQLKRSYHNHFDAVAQAEARVDGSTPVHKVNGWYLTADADSAAVLGSEEKVVREVTGGGVELTVAGLEKLEKDGQITHEQYLKLTKPVRVVDTDAVINEIAKGNDELAVKLASVSDRRLPTVAVRTRPNR